MFGRQMNGSIVSHDFPAHCTRSLSDRHSFVADSDGWTVLCTCVHWLAPLAGPNAGANERKRIFSFCWRSPWTNRGHALKFDQNAIHKVYFNVSYSPGPAQENLHRARVFCLWISLFFDSRFHLFFPVVSTISNSGWSSLDSIVFCLLLSLAALFGPHTTQTKPVSVNYFHRFPLWAIFLLHTRSLSALLSP